MSHDGTRMRLVYFVKPVGMAGPIKIGCSDKPADRLQTLMFWAPFPLEVVCTIPGNLVLERNIHECFADAHSHSEWFFPVVPLLKMLDALKRGVPIEEAMDLSKRAGSIRKKRNYPDSTKQRMGYTIRLRHASKRATKSTGARGLGLPTDVDAIISNWSRGQRPNAAEFTRLEQVIAAPSEHCISYEVKWPGFKFSPRITEAAPEGRMTRVIAIRRAVPPAPPSASAIRLLMAAGMDTADIASKYAVFEGQVWNALAHEARAA